MMLAELRDAVGGDEGSRMADQAARKIAKKYPTLSYAKRAFKEQGLNYKEHVAQNQPRKSAKSSRRLAN